MVLGLQGRVERAPILSNLPDNVEIAVVATRDLLALIVLRGEKQLRCNVYRTIRFFPILEPRADAPHRSDVDRVFLVLYASDCDVSEDPAKRFHVMSIQSRNTTIQSALKQVNSHEWNGARAIVVRGRAANPGSEVEIVDHPQRDSPRGDAVHQVLEADIAMVYSIHPQPVMTWVVGVNISERWEMVGSTYT